MHFGQGAACLHQLSHGDVVVLESVQSSTAYAVEVRETEAGSVAQLQLTASPVEVAAAQPAAALEVVQQGEWYGLRSLFLDGLFLQARKKAPSLVFFSNRLGVWEQWKVEPLYQGVLQQHSPAICLTSRQVPSVSLSARAWRVGSTAPALPIHVPPQHLPAAGLLSLDASAGYALTYGGSGGGATVTSAGRSGTEGGYAESVASSSLQDEALELSHNVVKGYVTRVTKWPLFLAFRLWRAEARAQRSRRAAAAASAQLQQEAEAALAAQQRAAVERHQRHMMLLACQCWARLRTRQLSRALQDWHGRARRSGHLQRLQQVLQTSLRRRHMAAVLEAWSRYAHDRGARLVQLRGFYLRMASRRARAVLLGWREAAAEQRFAIAAVQQRRGAVLLAAVLRGWWGLVEQLQAARQRAHVLAGAATDAALFSILHAWRGCCLRRQQLAARAQLLLVATARRILATAWGAWRDETDAAAERRQRAGLLAALRRQHAAAAVLRHWAVRVAEASTLRFAAEQMGARRRRRLLPAVFTAWRAMADLSADLEDEHSPQAATRFLDILHRLVSGEHQRGVLRRLLAVWRRMAADGVRRVVMADAMRRVMARSRTAEVLLRWRELLRHQVWVQSELLAVYRQGAARKALQGWADVATGKARLASTAALVGRRLWRRRLSLALGSWRAQAARTHGLWNAASSRATVSLARRMLQGWRRRCDVSRAWLGALGRCRGRYERTLLAASMHALHARVSLQQRVAALAHKCGVALARRALRGWRQQAVAGLRLQSFGRLLHAKWRRALSRAVLRSWFLAAHSASLQLHLLEALEVASLSGGAAASAGAASDGAVVLPAWQAAWPAGWAPGAAVAGFYVPPVSSAAAGAVAAAAAAAFDRRHAAVLRLLVASLGGVGASGGAGNGGSAAMWAAAELLLTRLPLLARLASRVRRQAAEVLRAWHARASYTAGLTRTGARLQRRCRQLLLGTCFRGWRTTVTAVRARRGTAMLLVRRAVKALGVECLRAWRQAAARAARLRRTVLLLLGRRVERLKRAVLLCWLEEVHDTRARREEARCVKADARLARMGRTLRAWQEAVAAAGDVRAVAERRFAATWMRFKREVLLMWRNVVELSQHHLATCVRLVRKRAERRCAGAALGVWRAYAQHERERRENWPLLCRVFLAWLTLVQPAGRAAQAARERLESLEQESAARRSTQRREHTVVGAPQLSAAGARPGLPADSDSSMPTALRAATAAPEPATVVSPVSYTGPSATAPMAAAPSAPASISASAPASATAAAAAEAASQPPGLSSLPSLRPIIVGPSAVEAAGSPVPGDSEDGRSSPPVEEVHFANRRRSTRDTDNEAGAMVAQPPPGALGSHPAAYMWQQWHNMMQTERANSFGGGAGAIPLPFGAWGQLAASVQAAAEGGDAAALKDRLGKLEEAIKTQREQEEAAKAKAEKDKESASSAPVAASSPPAPAYRPPPPPPTLAPTGSSSARVMTASCRPEPGPMYQIRQGNNTTVGRASTNSLTGLATVDSGNSANAPSPSTTPPPGSAAAAAPAAAPAAPTVHVVVHNPYGGPAGPYDPSRPDSPTGGDSVPLGWNWSRRATTDAVVAAAEALLERRSRKKLDVPPMQREEDEDEDGAVTTVPYEGPGATRGGRSGGRGAAATGAEAAQGPAVAAAVTDGSTSQRTAQDAGAGVGGGSSGGAGVEPAAQSAAGVVKPVQVLRGSSAGTGEDLLLPLTPVPPGSAAGTSSGAAADAAAESSQLPPQLRFQLGPPPKRVSPAQAPSWQQQPQPHSDDGPGLQAAAHPDAMPLEGDGNDGSPRSSAGGGGATLFQPTARRSMSRLSNASFNYSAWGAASTQMPLPPSDQQQQQEPPQQLSPGRPSHGQELGMPLPLLPQHGAAPTGAMVPAVQGGQQPIVLSPNDSQEQQALQQQGGQQQQQQGQQPIYITQHLVDGRTVVYAHQGAAGPVDGSLPHPQQQHQQQRGPQALTYVDTQQQQQQQRPDSGRAHGRHRVSFAPEVPPAAASGQPAPLPVQQPQPGVVYAAPTAQALPGAVVAPGVMAAAQLPAGASALPPGWTAVPAGTAPPAASAGSGAAAVGWQGAAPGTAFAVLYPPAAAVGTSGMAQGMLVLQAAPASQQTLAPAAAVTAADRHASGSGGGTLAADIPAISDMDSLLGELEARSRAAMTSPRRAQGARPGGGAGGGGGRRAYSGPGARAATAGGAMAGAGRTGGGIGLAGSGAHAGGGAGGGLQGLDTIDSLHVRATTLSAPGAPVFGSWGPGPGSAPAPDGQAATSGHRAMHTAADDAGGGSAAGGGLPSEVDAALRRLEAASVHAHAAAAAWTAVAQQVEEEVAESGERDMSRLAAAVEAAAAAATAAATSSASAAERTTRAPAAAARARPGSGGRAQSHRAAGVGPGAGAGGAADLLATFLPGAQEAMRRHTPPAAAAYRAQQQARVLASPRYSQQDEAELASAILQPFRAASRPEPRWLADASAAAGPGSEKWAGQGRLVHQAGHRHGAAWAATDAAYFPHSQPQTAHAGHASARSSYEAQQQQLGRRRQPSGGSADSEVGAAAGAEACPTCGSPTRPGVHSRHAERPTRGAHAQGQVAEPEPMRSGREERRVRWSTDGERQASAREQRHLEAHADVDALSELAMLAQRRGNAHLAATLAALSGPAGRGGGGAAREPSPRELAYAAAPPPAAVQGRRSVPGAASDGRSDALPPPVQRGREAPLPSSVAAHPPHDRGCTRAPASAPPTPPRFVGSMAAAAGVIDAQPPIPGALAANLPRRPSTQGSTSSASSVTTSSPATSAGSNGGPTLPALIDVDGSRLDAFDPDPLGSPLKGVLGECRRLQAAAVRREEEGHAVLREVVSGLSPRSAVAAALRAVMEGPQGCGGAVEASEGGSAGAGSSRAKRAILTSSRRV